MSGVRSASSVVQGGFVSYGGPIGILRLESNFAKSPGLTGSR